MEETETLKTFQTAMEKCIEEMKAIKRVGWAKRLAEDSGLSESFISLMVRGKKLPGIRAQERLALACGFPSLLAFLEFGDALRNKLDPDPPAAFPQKVISFKNDNGPHATSIKKAAEMLAEIGSLDPVELGRLLAHIEIKHAEIKARSVGSLVGGKNRVV